MNGLCAGINLGEGDDLGRVPRSRKICWMPIVIRACVRARMALVEGPGRIPTTWSGAKPIRRAQRRRRGRYSKPSPEAGSLLSHPRRIDRIARVPRPVGLAGAGAGPSACAPARRRPAAAWPEGRRASASVVGARLENGCQRSCPSLSSVPSPRASETESSGGPAGPQFPGASESGRLPGRLPRVKTALRGAPNRQKSEPVKQRA